LTGAAFSPDSKLVVTTSADKTARVWEATSGVLVRELKGHRGTVRSAAFSRNGKFVLTGSSDGSALVWELRTGNILMEMGVRGSLREVSRALFSPDGKIILVTDDGFTATLYRCDMLGSIEELIAIARDRQKSVD
jgi:WD40 repeat protein